MPSLDFGNMTRMQALAYSFTVLFIFHVLPVLFAVVAGAPIWFMVVFSALMLVAGWNLGNSNSQFFEHIAYVGSYTVIMLLNLAMLYA